MTFNELEENMKKIGIYSLAEIARELDVSPQSVSNWKARNQVPYKYVVYIQDKYNIDNESIHIKDIDTHGKSSDINDNRANNNPIIKNESIYIFALLKVLQNDRKFILQIIGIITFIGIMYSLFSTPLYKSTITMYPAGSDSNSKLQGLASLYGFDMGISETSFHIPDIIESRRLKTYLIYNEWRSENFEKPVNLIHYWDIDYVGINLNPIIIFKKIFSNNNNNNNVLKWEESALLKINNRISVNEKKSGLIKVNVLMEEPEIASEIANAIYPTILEFTIEEHAKQARLNREFIETRQNIAKIELSTAEEKLKKFRQRNRSISDSPELQMDLERLIRDVQIQTEVYITLQQQYELARIEEVKETPSVVILDKGEPAVVKDSPKRKLIAIISLIIGSIVGISISIIKYNWKATLKRK